MNNQNARLPQPDGGLFLTDGGIETTLPFQDGFDLPFFAAFPLLRTGRGLDERALTPRLASCRAGSAIAKPTDVCRAGRRCPKQWPPSACLAEELERAS